MPKIVEKDWRTVDELIRWWHNRPKQIVGSEIDMAMEWAWKAALAADAKLKSPPCPVCKSKNTDYVSDIECNNCCIVTLL
jgi:hypothetical protein